MFRFANPNAFQLLWLVPIVVAAGYFLARRNWRKLRSALGGKTLGFLTSSYSPAKRRLKLAIEALVVVFFVIALARPQIGGTQEDIKSEGVELIIAVDVSESMLAEDVKPSRLEFAKKELSRLLDKLGGDKVGVVAFAGSAALLSPMSTDKNALKMYLESLSPNSVGSQGTEFKRALEEAKGAFDRGGAEKDGRTAVTRVVLIVSDGEDNESGALEEAKKLRQDDIRIFGLAFGTEKGAPIPVRDANDQLRGYKRDRAGKTILSQTQGTVLKELAKVGEGGFYHATFGSQAIEAIADDISRLEKTEFENQKMTNYSERYQIFLLCGLVLAWLELVLGERAKGGRLWKGRFEVAGN